MARIFYQFKTISIIIIYNYQISNYIKNISDKNILGKRDICYNLVWKKLCEKSNATICLLKLL